MATYLADDIKNWRDNIIHKMAGIQAPSLCESFGKSVLLHHLVVKEPHAFGHMPDIGTLSPHAEEKDQINDATGNCWWGRHCCIHLREARGNSHSSAPLHVI